jgi:hypothetical protein
MCPETGGKTLEEVDLVFIGDQRDAAMHHGSPDSDDQDVASEKHYPVSDYNEKA